jgi:FkbM family methyltransferase
MYTFKNFIKKNRLARNIIRIISLNIFYKLLSYYTNYLNNGRPSIYCQPRDSQGLAITVYGAWEHYNIEAALRLSKFYIKKNKSIALDIGANIGSYTLNLANNFDKIIAVEASPIVGKILEANILTNRMESKIDANIVALGNKTEIKKFNVNLDRSGLSSFKKTKSKTKTLKIKVLNGDLFISRKLNASDKINYIKCDVEGFEYEVLLGLKNTLIKHKPLIQIEYDGKNKNHLKAIKLLKSIGYINIYKIKFPFSNLQARLLYSSFLFQPKIVKIETLENKFYQAIWLSHLDIEID